MEARATEKKQRSSDKRESILKMDHIKKSFGKKEVLKDISIELFKGENLVVLGKSGSGKSVLIKCIVGLIEPDSGDIQVLGQDVQSLNVKEMNAVRKKVGFLFQSGALYDSMTVRENLLFPLRDADEMDEAEKTRLAEEVLDQVNLSDSMFKMPSELSGGMRKRLGLARTLILKPDIMLYDEPTTGLDPITSREISELILKVQKEFHTSSIIITHDMPCARLTGNRIVVFKEGLCYEEGTYEELEKSKDDFVKSFFEFV